MTIRRVALLHLLGAVILLSSCGGGGDGDAAPPPVQTAFKTFITTAEFTGDIRAAGGMGTAIASADALCQADAGKPAGSATYKAMLVDGVNRIACATMMCAGGLAEHVDWVFKPNADYYQSDGTTLVFTANANGVFDFSSAGANRFGSGAGPYWTGLNEGVAAWVTVSNQLCSGASGAWSDTAGIGDFGSTAFTGWGAIGGGAQGCTALKHLVCVEQ